MRVIVFIFARPYVKEIVYPILCIFALIRIIYDCNDIAVFLVDIEYQTAFIQFVDMNSLLALYFEITRIIIVIYFKKSIFML